MAEPQPVQSVAKDAGGRWDDKARIWLPRWRLSLACGHLARRTAKDEAALPKAIACHKCAISGKTIPGLAPSHAELCAVAERWLRNHGCGVVLVECVSGAGEQPDAIGWYHAESRLIECKTSHADFRADRHKTSRRIDDHGPGRKRWFLAPAGVIPLDEVPPLWGLLVWDGRQVVEVREATYRPQSETGRDQDVILLVAALRRAQEREAEGVSEASVGSEP